MDEATAERVVQLKREVQALQDAIGAATREGNIRRNAELNLQVCRLRKDLNALQAQASASEVPLPAELPAGAGQVVL
ncbi:MAG: hypothetical protein U1G07_21210 [Verrucomicrobiota bacterium]